MLLRRPAQSSAAAHKKRAGTPAEQCVAPFPLSIHLFNHLLLTLFCQPLATWCNAAGHPVVDLLLRLSAPEWAARSSLYCRGVGGVARIAIVLCLKMNVGAKAAKPHKSLL
ncbi:hypothetical protein ABPG75_002033 [Micractinium tetrahymenae]